jgi:enamine deaminase RidA (YjgF/YER057c/UK114 family)
VKILVLVASADEFYDQPYVANGGSQLLVDLFGEEAGAPSRSAIGVNVLPGNIPVEIEAIFEIEK